jgi:amidase
MMQRGSLTSRALTQRYLSRIDAMDKRGPSINAVIELNPDALAIADERDAERKAGRVRGALHGIPVLIKDNIDSADRMRTSAGSLALATNTPPRDAFILERLRAAGAVLIGKTNLSEWANYRSTHSSSGWSGRGGQTRNPYVLDRNPCGSSSGTGAAIAADFATVGIGTETDGSIICPSSINGLVGIKPTVGLWSRSGIIPISASQDTAGPMARSVADAAALLGALTGVDARDNATIASRGKSAADYTTFLKPNALKGARIGVARNLAGFSDFVDAKFNEAIAALKGAGAVIVDATNLTTAGKFDDAEGVVLDYEFKAGINAYLASLGPNAPMRTLADLIAFNDREKAREMPWFGQEIFLRAEKSGPLTDRKYLDARGKCLRLARTEGIDAVMAKHQLDTIICPSNQPAWPTDWLNGDHFTGGNTSFAAVAGYPSITVPMGYVRELPVGLSFIGRAWDEGKLISLAFAFEQATKVRRAPSYLPTLT